jgi:hypothetical protein
MTTTSVRRRAANVLRAAAPPAAFAAAVAILLRFPPGQYSFYPRCPFYELFHLQCPGCGATRALAALIHGDIADAIHFNALATLLFPAAAIYGVALYVRFLKHLPIRCPHPPFAAVCVLLVVTVFFGVTRNIPF